MKKGNISLVTGATILVALALLALAGPLLAPYPPDYSDNVVNVHTEKGPELYISPIPPMSAFPLGTDQNGRDILSLLLYGARFSLAVTLVVAFLRIFFATLTVLAARGNGRRRHGGSRPLSLWGVNAVPQFIIIYFILYSINFNSPLTPTALTLIQIGLLVLFGLPGLIPSITAYTEELQEREFVLAAQANGAGSLRVLHRHILPHLREKLLLLFSQETVAVLTLVGQLGIFNIFIGGTVYTPFPALFHSVTYEWAGLVGQYRFKLHAGTWWILFFPLLGFTLLLLGFYLTSRGVEKAVQAKYHRVTYL